MSTETCNGYTSIHSYTCISTSSAAETHLQHRHHAFFQQTSPGTCALSHQGIPLPFSIHSPKYCQFWFGIHKSILTVKQYTDNYTDDFYIKYIYIVTIWRYTSISIYLYTSMHHQYTLKKSIHVCTTYRSI